jgi:diadenylate cyclase
LDTKQNERLLAILRRVAPGTPLRQSCERIIASRHGALIVLSNRPEVMSLSQGGFEINSEFLPTRLYELAKMDGAIIVSSDFSRILRANVHLTPDNAIVSRETGTRSRTSERVAKQTGAPVLCVSEEMGTIFLFMDGDKYALDDLRLVMARATQALQALEKYTARLKSVLANLTNLEFEGLAVLEDVVGCVQRFEMVERVVREINGFVIELGVDGRLVEMQLDEMTAGVKTEHENLLKDYCKLKKNCSLAEMQGRLQVLTDDELLDMPVIARAMGYAGSKEALGQYVTPKGYRLLARVPRLSQAVVTKLVERFGNLNNIVRAGRKQLEAVDGVGAARARILQDGLRRLSETNVT